MTSRPRTAAATEASVRARQLSPEGPAVPVPLRLPPGLVARLDERARATGVTRADLVRDLLERGLAGDGETAALRRVLAYASAEGLAPERLVELLGEV